MKMRLFVLGAFVGAAVFTSCGEQAASGEATKGDTALVIVDSPATTTIVDTAAQAFTGGKVLDIQKGKDGYTAKLITTANDTLFATISHANLRDHASYKTASVGDSLWVKGDTFSVGTELHMAVRYIK